MGGISVIGVGRASTKITREGGNLHPPTILLFFGKAKAYGSACSWQLGILSCYWDRLNHAEANDSASILNDLQVKPTRMRTRHFWTPVLAFRHAAQKVVKAGLELLIPSPSRRMVEDLIT